jgi:hypothetical protein
VQITGATHSGEKKENEKTKQEEPVEAASWLTTLSHPATFYRGPVLFPLGICPSTQQTVHKTLSRLE